ncbi:MAG TPA: VWA domain-containing protein, partial [Thermoanaerobaculia bacterium]
MGNPRLPLFLFLCAGLAFALPGGAQAPDAPASTFAEAIDVEVVELEVYATDDAGRPVTGLGPGDFTVRVDGREVEVTGFYAAGEPAPAPAATAPAAGTPPEPPTAAPAPDSRAGVSFVIYIENGYLDPGQRGRAMNAVEEFFAGNLRPGDRVMVVSHDLALEVLQPFTTDLDRVQAAFSSLSHASSRGVHNQAEWVGIYREIEQSEFRRRGGIASNDPCAEIGRSVADRIRGLHGEAQMSLEALRSVAESLAGVEGRKMLLFVGAGPPLRPGEDLLAILGKVCGRGDTMAAIEFDLTDELHDIAVEANTAGVTIHTLDAGGLRARMHGTVTAEIRGLLTPEVEHLTVSNVHDTIYALADQTGGRAILNANDPRPDLELVGEDLTTFYSLAFADPHGRDGRVHRVAVEVGRPGVRLRYRETYRSQPVAEEMREGTLAALYHGDGEPFAGGRLVPGEPTVGEGGIALPVRVDLPFAGITLLPGATGELEARLRLFVAIRDVHGRVTEVQEVPLPLRVSRDKYPDGPPERLVFPLRLTIAPGQQTLGVTVWDELGGTVGVLRLDLDVER